MPRLRKTPIQQQEKISKEELNQNTVTLTRTRRTPKPNPRYSSTDAFTPTQVKQPSIKSRSNSPDIVKEEKHIPVLRKRGITPDSADYAKLAPKKRLIDRASTPKTEPTRKLPERVAKNVQSVQKPTNTQIVIPPTVKQRPTVKMTRSSLMKKLDDEFMEENDTDENKTDDTDDDKPPVAAAFTRTTRDSTRRSLNSIKPTNKVPILGNRSKSDRIFIATSEDDNTEPDDEDMENIDDVENKNVEVKSKSKNGVKNFTLKNYGKKNDLNKAIENEATIVETVSRNNVPTFTIVNINDIINKKSNDDSMDSIDLTASLSDSNNSNKNVINQETRGGRRKTVHKVLTDNIVNNNSNNNNNNNKPKQQQRILNKTLGSNVVASSGNQVKGGKTLNQINKPRILNAMLAKGLAEHKAATTTLKIIQTTSDKQQQQQQSTANGLKMYQQQQQQQQKTMQNQLIRRDYHPKVQTAAAAANNNLIKQQASTTITSSNVTNKNNINIVRTYGRLNDKNTINKQQNNNNNKILNNNKNNKLSETAIPAILTGSRKQTSSLTPLKSQTQFITNSLNKKNTIIRQQASSTTATGITINNNNNNKLLKRFRKITCFETWYVINIPKYQIKLNNTILMFGLVNLGNNIKNIKLPSSEWGYKIILEKYQNSNNNNNNSNNNLNISNNNNNENENDNSLLNDINEIYTGDLHIINDNKDNNINYKPFIIQFHRFLKEKTKNNDNNEIVEINSDAVDATITVGEIKNSTVDDKTQVINTSDTQTIIKENDNDEKSKEINNNLIEFYDNNNIKEFNINNYYKNNLKQYDRLLIFKNNQYYLLIDDNLCKLIGQPKYINNINDVEILLNIINDINIINSYIYVENKHNYNNKNDTDNDEDTDNDDADIDGDDL